MIGQNKIFVFTTVKLWFDNLFVFHLVISALLTLKLIPSFWEIWSFFCTVVVFGVGVTMEYSFGACHTQLIFILFNTDIAKKKNTRNFRYIWYLISVGLLISSWQKQKFPKILNDIEVFLLMLKSKFKKWKINSCMRCKFQQFRKIAFYSFKYTQPKTHIPLFVMLLNLQVAFNLNFVFLFMVSLSQQGETVIYYTFFLQKKLGIPFVWQLVNTFCAQKHRLIQWLQPQHAHWSYKISLGKVHMEM